MFPKRFIYSFFLLLLVVPFLGAQDAGNGTVAEPAPVVVNVTPKPAAVAPEPTTAKAVLIVEESTPAPAAAAAPAAAPAEPKPEPKPEPAPAKAAEPAPKAPEVPKPAEPAPAKPAAPAPAKPAEPAPVKPAEPAPAKPAEPAPKATETVTKAPEPAPKAAETVTQAAPAPEAATKAPEPKPLPPAPKLPQPAAPAKTETQPKEETKEKAPETAAAKPAVTEAPKAKTEDKKSDALPAADKPAAASSEKSNKVAANDDEIAQANKTEIDSSKVVIIEPNTDSFHIENATTEQPAQRGGSARLINDFMPDEWRNNGGIIVHILLLAYACLALGVICDIYFLSSLEFISKKLNIPADIAGATFMAIGTSAPELFTSLIGVFILHDDIGTGTILGSAVFNLIFIPATCGLIIWKYGLAQAKISKYSILRDCLFYFVTITTLLLVLKDNEVDWVESLCMLGLFVVYLIIMYYNAKIGDLVKSDSEQAPLLGSVSGQNEAQDWQVEKNPDPDHESAPVAGGRARSYSIVTEDGDVEEGSWINSSTFMKCLMFPAMVLFKITLPKPTKTWYPVTFVISIVWISVLTYISVYLVDIIGVTFGIPETVGGLTLLAAGTSFPELISSALVVKRAGLADMALCNSIGSNIFDILVCLGLPWFIKSILAMFSLGTLDLVDTMVPIQSMGLSFTTFTLLITIVLFVATLSCFKWRLGFGVGLTCLILYVIFITLATVNEIVLN